LYFLFINDGGRGKGYVFLRLLEDPIKSLVPIQLLRDIYDLNPLEISNDPILMENCSWIVSFASLVILQTLSVASEAERSFVLEWYEFLKKFVAKFPTVLDKKIGFWETLHSQLSFQPTTNIGVVLRSFQDFITKASAGLAKESDFMKMGNRLVRELQTSKEGSQNESELKIAVQSFATFFWGFANANLESVWKNHDLIDLTYNLVWHVYFNLDDEMLKHPDDKALLVAKAQVLRLRSVLTPYRGQCASCFAEGARLKCGRCGIDRYCNADCQRKAWTFHKTYCGKLSKEEIMKQLVFAVAPWNDDNLLLIADVIPKSRQHELGLI
jgi:hypothetical protein